MSSLLGTSHIFMTIHDFDELVVKLAALLTENSRQQRAKAFASACDGVEAFKKLQKEALQERYRETEALINDRHLLPDEPVPALGETIYRNKPRLNFPDASWQARRSILVEIRRKARRWIEPKKDAA